MRDHCHITGKFRGAAHNVCNLKLKVSPFLTQIPVVFHNLKVYDSHLIMQEISKIEENNESEKLKGYNMHKLSCIPNNAEKYISFNLGHLRFIDSVQFLLSSLDKLVSANDPRDLKITRCFEKDEVKRSLLLRKGIYPYEFIDSWDRFEKTSLPSIDKFYSKLNDSGIAEEDYSHALKVWEKFKCKNIGDYYDLYCRTDVLLLADVFENFRKKCSLHYKLDPAHYFISPGMSWDALLKKTGVDIELLTDYDQYIFIERGIREGISMSSKRFAKANNPMVSDYDPEKEKSYVMYLDANNLYGWAMSQALPTGGFEWVKDCNELEITIISPSSDSDKGYILEVDLEYPHELHDTHNAYPLAPEMIKVKDEWLSEYQKKVRLNKSSEVAKLVPNLRDKERYIIHYRNLQLYVSLGMKLTKIHRALIFNQSAWMEPYIKLNTELRKNATNNFEKDLFKLMNNSVFGKNIENLRKRVDVKLVRSWEDEKLRKLIASPSFNRAKIFDNNLTAIHMHKSYLMLNRSIFVGMNVLDLSKVLMYDFYYNKLKTQYGENIVNLH